MAPSVGIGRGVGTKEGGLVGGEAVARDPPGASEVMAAWMDVSSPMPGVAWTVTTWAFRLPDTRIAAATAVGKTTAPERVAFFMSLPRQSNHLDLWFVGHDHAGTSARQLPGKAVPAFGGLLVAWHAETNRVQVA